MCEMCDDPLATHIIKPENAAGFNPAHLDPKWEWERHLPSPGFMQVDFENRVNYDRLRKYRLARAKQALKNSGCGALLLFDVNNVRYVSATKIGEWDRDKMSRFALLAGQLSLGRGKVYLLFKLLAR